MLTEKPTIGIIGGAGPTAGAYLFQKIIDVCQHKYCCKQDKDFPHVLLISYPFSDMLGKEVNRQQIENELNLCIQTLQANKVRLAAIACNTLHGFITSKIDGLQLVHFIEEVKQYLEEMHWKNPLILCSTTAAKNRLHAGYFSCNYPEPLIQKKIDDLIERVTQGCNLKEASSQLNAIIADYETVVLGCTELSVIHESNPLQHSHVCNPNELVAEKLCTLAVLR